MLLLDSSILCVSRLLDNEAKQMTVLRAITDTINDKGQQGDVTEQLKKTRKSYQRIIDDRNTFIAHGNYEAVRDRMSKGPTGAESTISDCRDAARDIRALIEKICDKSGLPRPEQLAEDPKWKGVDQTLKQLCDL
ncbi:MAG: hypothetical protein P8011_06755 [Acidihalobacter sp.]|uniref:hypothetical protein n=1 Tax=Acidihalobacter sp. TaxID=1872108 RepID=UPI00307ECE37